MKLQYMLVMCVFVLFKIVYIAAPNSIRLLGCMSCHLKRLEFSLLLDPCLEESYRSCFDHDIFLTGLSMDLVAWMDGWRSLEHVGRVLVTKTRRGNLCWFLQLAASRASRQQ